MELSGKNIAMMEAITVSGTTTFMPTMLCDSNSQHLQQSRMLTRCLLMLSANRFLRLWKETIKIRRFELLDKKKIPMYCF